MIGNPQLLIAQLFSRVNGEDISVEELREITEEFPSFHAAHFLLSKKLQKEGHPDFEAETRRTALYFTNPFWLDWLLNYDETKYPGALPVQSTREAVWEEKPDPEPAAETGFHPQPEGQEKPRAYSFESTDRVPEWPIRQEETLAANTPGKEADTHYREPVTVQEQDFFARPEANDEAPASMESNPESGAEPDERMEESLAHIALARADEAADEPFFRNMEDSPSVTQETGPTEPDHPAAENEYISKDQPTASQEPEKREPPVNSGAKPERPYYFWEKEFYHPAESSKASAEEKAAVWTEANSSPQPAGDEKQYEEPGRESAAARLGDPVPEEDRRDLPYPATDQVIAFDEIPILAGAPAKWEQMNTPADTSVVSHPPAGEKQEANDSYAEADEELKFEPYHTIDYFASQGIRYEQEDNPTDKFGKQLKSFTAWLKTMKKLPKAVLESDMNDITEAAIQSIAEHSIEEKEVITEAMAEVLVLQGKSDKAIELYTKLSLLNPAKSAFFAARIEQLKPR